MVETALTVAPGVWNVFLYMRADLVNALVVEGQPVNGRVATFSRGAAPLLRVRIWAPDPEGVSIQFHLAAGADSVDVWLIDHSPELPIGAELILGARPETVVPRQWGDASQIVNKETL